MFTGSTRKTSKRLTSKTVIACLAVLFVVILGSGLVNFDVSEASGGRWHRAKFCSKTAMAAYKAGENEVRDDYWIAVGNCNNLSDAGDRAECLEYAKAEYKEGKELTRDQREARLEICEDLGEAPYDPQLDPENYIDPADITVHTANHYFPLVPGTKWIYLAKDSDGEVLEQITVIVKDEIKTIEYPEDSGKFFKCTVVNDVVEEYDDGEFTVIEDTDDWYIQHKVTGDVLYMGEIARDFELDLDGKAELVEIEGSWKAGKDSAKPGILMWGNPDPENEGHNLYRQEFALGNAEDMGGVISRGEESVTVPFKEGTTFA
ncbi:MAG: hypothetical protein WBM69_15050, partial [Desulfobacterales bacterium]